MYAADGNFVGDCCFGTAPKAVVYRIFIPMYSGNNEYLFLIEDMAFTTGSIITINKCGKYCNNVQI